MALPEGLELDPLGDWSIQGRHTFFLPAKMDRIAGWLDKDWVRLWGWGWVRVIKKYCSFNPIKYYFI